MSNIEEKFDEKFNELEARFANFERMLCGLCSVEFYEEGMGYRFDIKDVMKILFTGDVKDRVIAMKTEENRLERIEMIQKSAWTGDPKTSTKNILDAVQESTNPTVISAREAYLLALKMAGEI